MTEKDARNEEQTMETCVGGPGINIIHKGRSNAKTKMNKDDPSQPQVTQQSGVIMEEKDPNDKVPADMESVKTEDLANILGSEAMSQLSKQIDLPSGTCLVPAYATYSTAEPASTASGQLESMQATLQKNQVEGCLTNSMNITINYKIYSDSQRELPKVGTQHDLCLLYTSPSPRD